MLKQPIFKSKKLTNSARDQDCIRCGKDGETRACHYNGQRQHQYGKGRGIKCSDLMTAEFCHTCDQEFSEGSQEWLHPDERDAEFFHWINLTNIRRIANGVLRGD